MSAFTQLWTVRTSPIPADEEAGVIAAAQTGDEAATLRLFAAYQPALRAAVRTANGRIPLDDARQAASLGFLEAVQAFDPAQHAGGRLAGILREHVRNALMGALAETIGGFAVPARSLSRYFGILRQADGDPVVAALLAPAYAMAEETFWAIWAGLTANNSLDEAIAAHGAEYVSPIGDLAEDRGVADAEDRVLVDLAFSAVTDFERDVCRLKYGFTDVSHGDELSDDAVGYHLGVSRLKALRTRKRALASMASALGVLNV
ncbi:hypothetical protein [Micromonospora sp. KC213]|uniref:hypothetical protein n=1 Tax=Micromonospora sp. KC213 TaxID=2530378 RepID=UPI00104ECA48|nr:hypothetical protein [Micromonospora sp. KC213]TDC35707.1 hypothetical protein E1166_23205 [Micromonospora sp. KC213]